MFTEGTYNFYIVALSVTIAILASFSALNITTKISYASGKTKYFWLASGSVVMGSGIWSMHFLGMLAFDLHANVDYNIPLTLLSMVASVVSSFIALYITMAEQISKIKLSLGGLVMGSGITAMHYIGMQAMIMPMEVTYDKGLVVLSILIAFVASYVALFLFLRFKNQPNSSWIKWLAASFMGAAICGMHYVGMQAANFHSHSPTIEGSQDLDLFLLYSVSISTIGIIFISWGAMFVDRHVLKRMAYQDVTTGLPNRNKMNHFFDTYKSDEMMGVLFLDLDKFKAINDIVGHDVGDLLLQEVGARLSELVDKKQHVFRIGGDEFLLVTTSSDEQETTLLADAILHSLKEVYIIEGNELFVTASIGISVGQITSLNHYALFKTAEIAMCEAKKAGGNCYCTYTIEIGLKEERKSKLEKDIQSALQNNEFYIVYQPKWNMKTNSLHGFEALLRWQHPQLGVISPVEFIPITEETGLIVPITKWILESVSKQINQWQKRWEVQPVSVNLSIRLFQRGNLTEIVQQTIEHENLNPRLLELEVTESMIFYDVEDISQQLERIRSLGVSISMDDFGTGYSSIGLLDRIPIDVIKLDRMFINNLETPRKRAIIKAIIRMAESLHMDVIAEGVENKDHVDTLTELGCYLVQGYFYGRPMKVEEIDECFLNKLETSKIYS